MERVVGQTVSRFGRLDILVKAYAALFDEASFVTGTQLIIDGGFIAR